MFAIVTVCTPEYDELFRLTQPSMLSYAERCNVPLVIIRKIPQDNKMLYKLHLKEYFKDYDRILYLDADVVVNKDAPNLFDLVPSNTLAVRNENTVDKHFLTQEAIDQFFGYVSSYNGMLGNNIIWTGPYYNAGIFLCDAETNPFKDPSDFKYGPTYDQEYFNYKIIENKTSLHLLDEKWNRLHINGNSSVALNDAHFIHFAGYVLKRKIRHIRAYLQGKR